MGDNSFIENVNKIAENLAALLLINNSYNQEVIDNIVYLKNAGIQVLLDDLAKGNTAGDRKIDISLSLNNSNIAVTPTYSKADITLTNGNKLEMSFGSNLSTHSDIKNFIVNHALFSQVKNTNVTVVEASKVLIRFTDIAPNTSNIAKVELYVATGQTVENKPAYNWEKTSSSVQILTNKLDEVKTIASNINSVLGVNSEIVKLVAIYSNLTEILASKNNADITAANLISITALQQLIHNDTAMLDTNGAINDLIIAPNRAFSNSKIVSMISKRKQYLINGNFDSWQFYSAGLPYPQISSGYGSDDMWNNANLGSTKLHSMEICTNTERELFKVNQLSKTIVTSVAGEGNYVNKYQNIENVTELEGKTVTISFLAKADSNKNIAIELGQSFGTGGTPSPNIDIGKQLIALTPILTKYTLTVTFPSITGKTIGTNGLSTTSSYINFWFDAGSNFNSRASNLGQQSGTFYIGKVRIEDGDIATDDWSYYDGKFGAEEIAKLRYLEIVEGQPIQGQSGIYDTSNLLIEFNYKVRKRVPPSISNIVPSNTLSLARVSEKHAVAKCINPDANNTAILVNANF